MRVIVGITGASGVAYGTRLLEVLADIKSVETHLITSQAGEVNIPYETDLEVETVKSFADYSYEINDRTAALSSGSFQRDGMVIPLAR